MTEAYTLLHSAEEGDAHLPSHLRAEPYCGSCRWLVSLDYDGTLRREDEGVEAEFFPLMSALRPHGVRWGINTGRSLHKMAADLVHFPHLPDFLCTCERYVYLAEEDGRLAPAAAHNARCHRANMQLREALLPTWLPALDELRRAHPDCTWEVAADDPLSIEAVDSATMDTLMPHLLPFAREGVAIQRAGRFMRLSDARYSKGSALRCVRENWAVAEESLFLMGDGHNDIDAFRHFPAAFRAAPRTAHPDVLAWLREHGGYLSPSLGVVEALRHWAQVMQLTPV